MKIISLKELTIKQLEDKTIDVLGEAKFCYGINIEVPFEKLDIFFKETYDFYQYKNLLYKYKEDMECYLDQMLDMAILKKVDKININYMIDALYDCPYHGRDLTVLEYKKQKEGKRRIWIQKA